jgi:hypothetical protein
MAESRDIKYINREFADFKQELIEYAKNYFPDSYNDFSPTSPGMMFIEMAAYVGDVMSFYQDTQLQETFLQNAKNPANLYSLAYMMGYRPKVSTPSEAQLTVTQRVEAVAPNYTPNWNQALKIDENAIITANSSGTPTFLINFPIDFAFSSSFDPTEVRVFSVDSGNPAEFLLSKKVKAFAGSVKTVTQTYTTAEKFATIEVEDTDIIRVLDIIDSDGNTWYEVPFLGQETTFLETANTGASKNIAPTVLSLQNTPRRFVTRFTSKGILQIQFGAGIAGTGKEAFLPDPLDLTNAGSGGDINQLFKAYDPSNFLFTDTYGLAPTNTTLTVRYLTGGGVASNVPANSITSATTVSITATDLTYQGTLTFNNEKAASGGKDGDTIEELRENSIRSFAEQQRTVTLQDYSIRALSLPPKFGTVAKVYATQTSANKKIDTVLTSNPLAVSLYVLSYNNNKHLINAPLQLKENLKAYLSQYIMIADGVNIDDAFIVNIGVDYEIITKPDAVSRDVLVRCTNALKNYFNISRWSINEPINLSPIYTLLDKIQGVQTVESITIKNKSGGNYSEYSYDVQGATKNNIVYPSLDPCIFEVKFPDLDIKGRVTTL